MRTFVAASGIHGNGLFAAGPIPRGTAVWRFAVGFDHDFAPEVWTALPEPARAHVRWFCFVSRAGHHLILSGDHACFINHASDPNTGAPPDAPSPVTTIALRDIGAGEELTCNYWAYDADTAWKLGLVLPDAPLGHGWERFRPSPPA